MTKEGKKCSICGAKLITKTIKYTQELDGKIYVVENVPAQVCFQCGEVYLSPDTVDALQKIINKGKAKEVISVPVYRFPAL